MIAASDKSYTRFDLRTKSIILIVTNALLFAGRTLAYECVLTGSSLIISALGGHRKSSRNFLVLFLLMLMVEYAAMPYLSGFWGTISLFIALSIRRILPCLIIGKWILSSTEVSEFVAVMWKLRLPLDVIIPISVVFRYFPTLKEEWQSLRKAMRMRGIELSVEHVFVPLMMSAVNIGEELSAAALCRGLDKPERHTCLRQVRFSTPDYLVMGFYALISLSTILLKAGGII